MEYILYGALGVVAVLALLAGGFAAGWRAHTLWRVYTRKEAAREATEEERKSLAAEQRAFETMLNYNLDAAYGGPDPLTGNYGEGVS